MRTAMRRNRTSTTRRIAGGAALAGAAVAVTAAVAYAVMRKRLLHWGATAEEAAAPLPGDGRVAQPDYVSTRAVTINAPPANVWPWLSQLGYHRGGLYSYDSLDRLFGYLDAPSAEEVLPRFQNIAVGDTIPLGRGPSWPVVEVEPERTLVIEPVAGVGTWTFVLVPVGENATRLLTRVRFRTEPTRASRLTMLAMDPASLVMTRRMLLGIKRRAERLAHAT